MAIYDAEYRRMAKAANQRLLTFERADMNSPAVLQAKAHLTLMGRRRFSETGKAETQQAINAEKRFLKQFLYKDMTSTKKGYAQYRQQVIDTAREKYNLAESGVSDDEYLNMWEKLDEITEKTGRKRNLGSDVYVAIIKVLENKYGEEEMPDIKGLLEKVEAAETYRDAVKSIGLTPREVNAMIRSVK